LSPALASLLVGAGGAAGAIARYWVGVLGQHVSPHFPAGTLAVNVVGGLLIGWVAGSAWASPPVRLLVMSGVLGGFTTFSTFSLEVVAMLERGRAATAAGYIAASVVLSVGGAAAGLALARGS
jgi:CrcB protein